MSNASTPAQGRCTLHGMLQLQEVPQGATLIAAALSLGLLLARAGDGSQCNLREEAK